MTDSIFQKYVLSGWSTVTIYSEAEMAQALGLTRDRLREAISLGQLVYHAHPTSNALHEYQFNESAYHSNLARWKCLKTNGHFWAFDSWYSPGKAKYVCQCGATKYD